MSKPTTRTKAHPPVIAIACVAHDTVPSHFAYDLASLLMYSRAHLPKEALLGMVMQTGTYVHAARQECLHALLADGVTHVLWVDSDMRFPRDSLMRLLSHRKDVVGVNYSQRAIDADYVAIKKLTNPPTKLVTNAESKGLEEVEAMGFGLMLMRARALKDLPGLADKPWFNFEHRGVHEWVGEDVYFCNLLREQGITLYVDHDLSKEVGHIGQFEFKLEYIKDK